MKEKTIASESESRICFENLDSWARVQVQGFLQRLLEDEVTELLGRVKYERREAIDGVQAYRNGYVKPRSLTLSGGTVTVRRPRVRGLEERFESRVLPLFAKRTQSVADAIPELYLHGLAEGDFDLALRGLLGDKAPLSASTVARLKQRWKGELVTWKARDLSDLDPVYIWVDGLYVKAGLEKTKAALLVVLAALSDGSKVVLSVTSGYRESTESWSAVLRDLKSRGLRPPRVLIADGHLGIWGALRNVWPEVDEQRCWNHRIQNVLDRVPKSRREEAKVLLRKIPYSETEQKAVKARDLFIKWCRLQNFETAGQILLEDWDRMVTFYTYPKQHWQHLRTTNPVESPFAAVRLRTNAAKRYKKVENATVVIWKMLLVAENTFRKLRSPQLCADVAAGTKYNDGIKKIERAAA